jgi:3-oxoacyl-[acyl-carrier-protein] synthase-1
VRIFVTGVGIVTAIGKDAAENLHSLETLTTGISRSNTNDLMLGEITLSNEELIEQLQLPADDYSRTSLLGLHAAREAWGNNKVDKSVRTGIISSTSVGGMDRTEKYYFDARTNGASNSYLMTHDNGRTTERIAARLGISGYIGTISTACSSGANAIMHGARLIQGKKLDRVIAGGSEPLANFDMRGFCALGIYDNNICKPFDDNRMGLNLGEGAAFLVLENEHSIARTGNQPICILSGWGNATDAFHQTASSPDGRGAAIAMWNALAKSSIAAAKIDYVNAHGTGTGNNDLSESMAFRSVFEDSMPVFSSTKGFTGHTLAAAGAIEAVYCVQAIQQQTILPNLNFSTPMKETGMKPETRFLRANIDYVLSNSFGFGGNCTSLVFQKS